MLGPNDEAAVLASPEDPLLHIFVFYAEWHQLRRQRLHRLTLPWQLQWKKQSKTSRLANTWKPRGILEWKRTLKYSGRGDNFGRSRWKGGKHSTNKALTSYYLFLSLSQYESNGFNKRAHTTLCQPTQFFQRQLGWLEKRQTALVLKIHRL